jgi:cytochrome c
LPQPVRTPVRIAGYLAWKNNSTMMKKFITFFILTGILHAGCGGNAEKKEEKQNSKSDITNEPGYKKGLALVAEYRCLTCHHISDRLTGPPYRDISAKYSGYSDTIISHLARRVIRGGNGVWGEVYMTPHPQVSQKDAEAMVKYVLMLKSN